MCVSTSRAEHFFAHERPRGDASTNDVGETVDIDIGDMESLRTDAAGLKAALGAY